MSWQTASTDGVWIFTHPDGRRIEALPNHHVAQEAITRRAIVDALDDLDTTITAGAVDA